MTSLFWILRAIQVARKKKKKKYITETEISVLTLIVFNIRLLTSRFYQFFKLLIVYMVVWYIIVYNIRFNIDINNHKNLHCDSEVNIIPYGQISTPARPLISCDKCQTNIHVSSLQLQPPQVQE